METRCGGLLFFSKFDGGNLASVEKVDRGEGGGSGENNSSAPQQQIFLGVPDFEFNVRTAPDCAGTEHENGNRSWFHFGVRGYQAGKLIRINIVNMNRQGKLYGQGMSPMVMTTPKCKWERLRDRPHYQTKNGEFTLSFIHRFSEGRNSSTYFAFCFPWSYTQCQNVLTELDARFKFNQEPAAKSDGGDGNEGEERTNAEGDETEKVADVEPEVPRCDNDIYYHRELLCYSMEKRRVDLITVTSYGGIIPEERETRLSKLFPDDSVPRPHRFRNKRVFVLSSRVHPGETPASHVFNGFLNFITNRDDPRAVELRKRFIFKMIPILNPDGVYRGHYRTDSRGLNLNRFYLDPDPYLHSAIYAARALILYHHVGYAQTNDAEMQALLSGRTLHQVFGSDEITQEMGGTPASLAVEGDSDQTNGITVECENKRMLLRESMDYKLIQPRDSGIAFYVDLHGHASKRGCFIFGNHIEKLEDQIDNMLYPRLISLNNPHFDFNACNFTEKNMYAKDKRDGLSKEGSGRVAMFKKTGILHSYTLECNYNCGRTVNTIPPATHCNGRSTPPPPIGFPPRYTIEIFESVGKAVAIAALDFLGANPWPRLIQSEFTTLDNLRLVLQRRIQANNPTLYKTPSRLTSLSSHKEQKLATTNNNDAKTQSKTPQQSSTTTRTRLTTNSRTTPAAAAASTRKIRSGSEGTSVTARTATDRLPPLQGAKTVTPLPTTATGKNLSVVVSKKRKNFIKRNKKSIPSERKTVPISCVSL